MQSIFQCSKCGAQNSLGQRFCIVCGDRFQYFCPQCNMLIDPDFKVCPNCAAGIDWGIKQQISTPSDNNKSNIKEKQWETQSSKIVQKSKDQSVGKKTWIWLILFIVIVVLILVIFVIDTFVFKKNAVLPIT